MKNSNLILVGSVVLILLAVGLVAILDRTSPASSSSDVRARASSKQALGLVGIVAAVDEAKGTMQVNDVQFADASRAGTAKDLGVWTVTAPAGFNFASVSPGMKITIGIDAATFQVTTHTMNALTIIPAK